MEWQERTRLLLGDKHIERLSNSHILIVGLGGVGGYAVEQLARAGIEHFTLVDSDYVNLSNINRQLIANHNNIGNFKTLEYEQRILSINPDAEIRIITEFLKDERLKAVLLAEKYDFVIDAIDTLSPKINLIRICIENNIPIISSMGAGGRIDPLKVSISDISKSYNCTLARILRKRLHRFGIRNGFDVVFSSEKIDKDSVIEEESLNKKSNVGTISYLPAIFGIMCASYVIRKIVER